VRSRFKIIDRGFSDLMVMVPGWAADYRIFAPVELNYSYLLPVEFCPLDFKSSLSEYLSAMSIDRVSVFGWSMGGFAACEFASKYPEKVRELMLLSVRKAYREDELKEIALKLEKNKRAFLYRFYLDCFSSHEKEGRSWFRENLLEEYISGMSVEYLLSGLKYLSKARICASQLRGVKNIKIFHGEKDKIAPIQEALEVKSYLPNAEFISLNMAGHIVFLNKAFKKVSG